MSNKTLQEAVETAIDDHCRATGTTRPALVISLAEPVQKAGNLISRFMTSRVMAKPLVDFTTKTPFARIYPVDERGVFTKILDGNSLQGLFITRPGMSEKKVEKAAGSSNSANLVF